MIRTFGRSMAGILASAVLVVVSGCGGPDPVPDPDPATLRDYAQQYVSLVRAKDEPGLRRHLRNDGQSQDAAERIAAFGGGGWTLSDVSWAPLTPQVYALSMVVDGPSGNATWGYTVEWSDGHWTMAPVGGRQAGAATEPPR
jgi:hypothetical protein